ncbi:MAG: hypothetical protein M1838_000277 [Thelocarpon superellum]|nr:MAG: hypothetical protein M1838_000277 [Thelocarpon superellum]
MFSYAHVFLCLWLYRYLRVIVNCIAHWTFRPIPPPDDPSLTAQDVTVIIPTLSGQSLELRQTVETCLRAEPFEILLVTIDAHLKPCAELARSLSSTRIRVFSVPHANKRQQMCRAIPEVATKITVLADDDVTWPRHILRWILAPFERADMGGVGTCQRLHRAEKPNVWNFLGALYLERRNFEISATTHIDGGISCLSGRTVAYRTHILQDPAFTYGFTHEYWLHRYQLNADDDNFITRWMVSHGWKTYVQYCKEAELRTTLEGNPKFLRQCLRWSRSNWRSNLRSMLWEQRIWRQQPWSAYALYLATLNPPALVFDVAMLILAHVAMRYWPAEQYMWSMVLLGCWMLISKVLKLLGHFIRYPEDTLLLPVSIFFGYFHGLIKAYAFCTLNVTAWGSREGADTDDAYRMIRRSEWDK